MNISLCKEAVSIIETSNLKTKSSKFKGWWSKKDCNKNPKALFVFGDNDIEKGIGGQAVIRNCTNTIGIPTKKYPSLLQHSFYTDAEFSKQVEKIVDAIEDLIIVSNRYDHIYFPEDGLGTGLAKLDQYSPKTFNFLNSLIEQIFGIKY